MDETFGLKVEDINTILSILKKETDIEQAVIFGSRAKKIYKTGSDVDIALKGINVNHETVNQISYILNEETSMPYKFDIVDRSKISNPKLAEHIDEIGISIYIRNPGTSSKI